MSSTQGLRSGISELVNVLLQDLAESGLCQEIVSDLATGVDYSVVRSRLLPLVSSKTRSIVQKPDALKARPVDEILTGLLMRYLERSGSCELNQGSLDEILDEAGPCILPPRPNVIIKRFQAVGPILNLEVKGSAAGFDIGDFVVRHGKPQEQQLMRPLTSIERAALTDWETPEPPPLWVVESSVSVRFDLDDQISALRSITTTQDVRRFTEMCFEWRTKFLRQFRKIEEDVRTLLLAVRLMKPEPVFIPQICFTDILFPWHSFSMPLSISVVEPFWEDFCRLAPSDVSRLRELYANLSYTLGRAKNERNRAYLLRAAFHFNKAGDEIDAGDAFIHYVIALEAMYLRAVEKMELKRRVGERAAALLYHVVDRPEAYKTVGKLYDLRSDIVHGGLSESKKKDLDMYRDRVRELVRRSLLCFADLDRKYDNKADIVSLLDRSLLEGEDRSVCEMTRRDSLFRKFLKYPTELDNKTLT